jgi:hypothetical protein
VKYMELLKGGMRYKSLGTSGLYFPHSSYRNTTIVGSELGSIVETYLTCFSRSVRLPSRFNDDVTYRTNQSELRVALQTAVVDAATVDQSLQDAASCSFLWYSKWHDAMSCETDADRLQFLFLQSLRYTSRHK